MFHSLKIFSRIFLERVIPIWNLQDQRKMEVLLLYIGQRLVSECTWLDKMYIFDAFYNYNDLVFINLYTGYSEQPKSQMETISDSSAAAVQWRLWQDYSSKYLKKDIVVLSIQLKCSFLQKI